MKVKADSAIVVSIFALFIFITGFALFNNYTQSLHIYRSNAIGNITLGPSDPCSGLSPAAPGVNGVIENPQTPNDPCAKKITMIPDCYCDTNYTWRQACGPPFAGTACTRAPVSTDTPSTSPSSAPTASPYPSVPAQVTGSPTHSVTPTYSPSPAPTFAVPTDTPYPTPTSYTPPAAVSPTIAAGINSGTRVNTALQDADLNGNCVIDTTDFFTAIGHFGQLISVNSKPVKVSVTYLSLLLANLTTKVCGN